MTLQRKKIRKWTEKEDEIVRKAVKKMKQNKEHLIFSALRFKKVTEQINRSPKQIQERYENVLRPGLKKGEWSAEEKIKLLHCIKEHGQCWQAIRNEITNRAFHSIKMKGRWMLGEVRTRKKPVIHQKLPKSIVWQEEEINQLKVLHESFEYNFKEIQKCLNYDRPLAQIERTIYFNCFCKTCVQVKAKIFERSTDFKDGWSKLKASHLILLEKNKNEKVNEDFEKLNSEQHSVSSEIEIKSCILAECENCNSRVLQFLNLILNISNELNDQNMKSTYFLYMTNEDILNLLNSFKKQLPTFFLQNSSLPQILKYKVNIFNDERYSMKFMLSEQNYFLTDRPVGSMAVENINLIIFDADEESKEMFGDDIKKKHYFSLQSSLFHGFYLYSQMYKMMMESADKSVWCHSLMRKKDRSVGVFLTHIEYAYYTPKVCRRRVQDVSDKFPGVLSLAPDL